jgi:hypothetical protein
LFFSSNDPRGKGTLTWRTGEMYMGEWDKGVRSGFGVLVFNKDSPTDRYEGEWKEGKITGKGTYFWKDGQKFEGNFENGLGVGFAVYTYKQV